MSKRFQNLSKFRNSFGKAAKREHWYSDLPLSTSSSSEASNVIAVSAKWLAVKWNSGAGGSLGILPINEVGKFNAAGSAPLLDAHTSPLTDWEFSEFDDNLLATGAEDGLVKIWKIPEEGLEADVTQTPIITITGHERRVESVRFHSTADKILTTSSGREIKIWDITVQTDLSTPSITLAGHGDAVQSFAWKGDGALIASTAKDLVVRVWDPRANASEAATFGKGHQGLKSSRVIWLGNRDQLFTTGYDKIRNRQYAIWDVRDLSKPIKMTTLDSGTGLLIPLFDEDTNKLFLVGKGDGTIGSMEIDEGSKPTIEAHMPTSTTVPQYGAVLLPKRSLDVMHAEIARLMVVTASAVVPVSFEVPRKQYLDFHAELFPDTKGNVPALTATEWLSGETKLVPKVSLDPSNKKRQSSPASNTTQPPSSITTTSVPTPVMARTQADTTIPTPLSAVQPPFPVPVISSAHQVPATATVTSPATLSSPANASLSNTALRFASVRTSYYRYIAGNPYHPSQHYDDLRGLSINKSGEFDLIQVNRLFFAVPLSGSGGRVGVFPVNKAGRLPVKIPAVVCGAEVTDFKFDPFDPTVLVTSSDDAKIRVWKIPEEGLEDDVGEPTTVFSSSSMDRISHIVFHPTAKNILLSASADRGNPTIRIWDVETKEEKITLTEPCGDSIFSAVWSCDGKFIATASKDKKIRIFNARSKEKITEGPSHESVRSSRLVWLGETGKLASVGFGKGSSREILLYNIADLSTGATDKKSIDISPSSMMPYYDVDCSIFYLAGRGDRSIYAYEINPHSSDSTNTESIISTLPKIEQLTLQQGFAFVPKQHCDVKAVEVAKMYRLTPTSVEIIGVRVPRSRTEFFQDDIFMPTHDVETPALSASAWLAGENKELARIDLRPADMIPLSQAPAPVVTHKKAVVRETADPNEANLNQQFRKMFNTAKALDQEKDEDDVLPQNRLEGVADDEWDD